MTNKLITPIISNCNEKIFVKNEGKYFSIKMNEINWVYAQGNYCTLFVEGDRTFVIRISLNKMLSNLSTKIFVQSHRNYLLNSAKIDVYDPMGTASIANNKLPISKKYKKSVENKLRFLN